MFIFEECQSSRWYSSNVAKCVKAKERKTFGLKSHDCHVLMECFLQLALHGLLANENIHGPLIELCSFFILYHLLYFCHSVCVNYPRLTIHFLTSWITTLIIYILRMAASEFSPVIMHRSCCATHAITGHCANLFPLVSSDLLLLPKSCVRYFLAASLAWYCGQSKHNAPERHSWRKSIAGRRYGIDSQ